MSVSVPDPLMFGTGAEDVPRGNDVRFGLEGTWDADITAAVQGDLTVAWTARQGIYERRPRSVHIWATLIFTLNYTTTAWTASTALAVGIRRTNGGNVYEVTTAGTTAASGGPTGTGASITDGTVVWKYISLATNGVMSIGGLPLPIDPAGPRPIFPLIVENLITFPNNGTNTYFAGKVGTNSGTVMSPKTAATPQSASVSSTQFGPGVLFTIDFNGAYRIAANL